MTKREFLDTVFALAPNEANAIMDAFDEYVDSNAPHWIPVTERLPKNGAQVLVYARSVHYALAKYDEMREADGTYKKQWVTFDAWKPFYTIKEVIAWMPLSEPYKGVTE
jgi:hypothetical protein